MKPYYEEDGILLFCGDCREVVPALRICPDATIADPPYDQTSLEWDRWPDGWLSTEGLGNSLWCFGSLRVFMDRRDEFSGWTLSQDVVWEKHNGSGFADDRFRRVHEQVAHFYRGPWSGVHHQVPRVRRTGPAKTVRQRGRTPHTGAIGSAGYEDDGYRLTRSVIYAQSMHALAENETHKPEGIIAPLVEYACPPSGLLLVPFAGSGADLLVAKLSGRRAIGIELRESQCEVAANALSRQLPLALSV